MIPMPSTLSHGNHVRCYSRNQVRTITWWWPCATACSCSKDSYRSRDTGGRKEPAWTTHSSRAIITLAGCARRAPQQRCWGWLIIIAIRSHLRYVAYVCPTLYRIRRRGSRTICASTVLPSRRFYSRSYILCYREKDRGETGRRQGERERDTESNTNAWSQFPFDSSGV